MRFEMEFLDPGLAFRQAIEASHAQYYVKVVSGVRS